MSSSNQTYSYSSYSTSSYSSSSGGHSQRYTETSHSNERDGTNTSRRWEETGKATIEEREQRPAQGRVGGGSGGIGNARRIEDVSEVNDESGERNEQAEKDRLYEERMEEEYAKREGGA